MDEPIYTVQREVAFDLFAWGDKLDSYTAESAYSNLWRNPRTFARLLKQLKMLPQQRATLHVSGLGAAFDKQVESLITEYRLAIADLSMMQPENYEAYRAMFRSRQPLPMGQWDKAAPLAQKAELWNRLKDSYATSEPQGPWVPSFVR